MTAGKRIDAIYALVAAERDGREGICAASMPFLGTRTNMPLVGADMDRVRSLRPLAEAIAHLTGLPVRLVRFSRRNDLEEI